MNAKQEAENILNGGGYNHKTIRIAIENLLKELEASDSHYNILLKKLEATERKLAEADKIKVAAIKVHDAFYTVELDADKTSLVNARNMESKIYNLKEAISDYEASKANELEDK